MLSPNVVEISEDIAAAFSQFLAVKSFSYSAGQIVVSPLSPDPKGLPTLRQRIAVLAKISAQWQLDYPDLVVNYLKPFTNYSTTFGAFAGQVKKFGNDVGLWTEALTALHTSILAAQTQAKTAATAFMDHLDMIKTVEGQLNQSLTTAWTELADEEAKIVALATQLVRLQDRVDQLQDNLTSAEISSGKGYFQTAATISYTIMTKASVEIPYLAIVTEVYTIGKMAYDLIVTDKEINEALQQIADLTVEASEAAQAAAMSKGAIQLINSMNLQVTGLNDRLPALNRMWETEAEKISAAIDAIHSGAVPSEVFDLVSMPPAAVAWTTLAELSRKAIATTPTVGKPVFLTNNSTKPRFSAIRA
jgi:hypothetical protein